ncbi:MAG TPA: M28 family peptidase [Bryobacteraceae bacterium]|nr:M28 family peptidase [Bryobacteraceae bacterium]
MLRPQIALTAACLFAVGPASAAGFSGAAAFEYARYAVGLGPRPSGSDANKKLQAYILEQTRVKGAQVAQDSFVAKTPRGPVPMTNLIVKFPGSSGKAIAITGHFDTKYFPGRRFVGANDGASSTAVLLALAHALAGMPRRDDLYLVFFDGEEAVGEWSGDDSVYGSRHLAQKWRTDGNLQKLKALINVDMIGDKHLDILQDENSDPSLRRLVWKAAFDLGYAAYFTDRTEPMDDDHMPFVRLGVPALDLIDFDYSPWHKDSDTLDKISGQSMEIVGAVVLESIHRLETR